MTDESRSLTTFQETRDVEAFAERLKDMFPGGAKLTPYQRLAFAQYCLITDVNPWRGEAYPFVDSRGEFHVIDGYKALVRWARRECPYSEKMVPLTTADGISPDDIGYRCYILRNDALPLLQTLIQAQVDPMVAYEMAASSAIGVVTKADRWSRKWNKEISAPTGWTWDEVARKRALKNALNRSHGAPSPSEFAKETWDIDGRTTIPDDWVGITSDMRPAEREAVAAGNAEQRIAHEHAQELMEAGMTALDATDDLFGEYDEPGFLDEETEAVTPEPEPPAPKPRTDLTGVGKSVDGLRAIGEAKMREQPTVPDEPPGGFGVDDTEDQSPHWIDDPKSRARWEAWLKKHGWTHETAKAALKVESIRDYHGNQGEAQTALYQLKPPE